MVCSYMHAIANTKQYKGQATNTNGQFKLTARI